MGGIIQGQSSMTPFKIIAQNQGVATQEKPQHETQGFDVVVSKKERKEQKQIEKFNESIYRCQRNIITGEINTAIVLLKDIIKTNKFLDLCHFKGLGNEQSWNGLFKEGAIAWLASYKKQNKEPMHPYDLLSICFYLLTRQKSEQLENCVKWYDQNIQNNQTYELCIGLGNLYYNNKNQKKAQDLYKRALELNTNFPKTYEYLAWVYGYWFDYDSLANQYASKYLEMDPTSITCKYIYALTQQNSIKKKILLEELIREEPNYYRAYINLGEIENDKEVAKGFYNKCLQFDDKFKFAYLKLGDLQRFTENFEEAERYYMKVKQIDELQDYVYFYLGCLSEDQGDYDEALILYQMCLEINPHNADICATIANLYRSIGDPEKAIEYMLKQLEQNPYDYQNCNLLGIFYDEEEQYQLAVQYFKKSIQINCEYYEPYVNMGSSHQEKKQYDEAIRYYLKASQLKPDEVDPYFGMAICQSGRKNYDKGIQWCFKCIDKGCDQDKQVYQILGDLYRDKKEFQKSLNTYLLYDTETKILHTEYIQNNLFSLISIRQVVNLLEQEFNNTKFVGANEFRYAQLGRLSLAVLQEELAKKCFQKLRLLNRLMVLHSVVAEQLNRYNGTSEHIVNNYHLGVRSYAKKIQLISLKRQFEQEFSKLYLKK